MTDHWTMHLYVAGDSPRSRHALTNLKRLCDEHVPGRYEIEVIDLTRDPTRAKAHGILAIPTLVRALPGPVRCVVGDLSNGSQTRRLLGFDAKGECE